MKRILHLTGQQVPDAVASQAKVIGDLIPSLLAAPKAKKLADELAHSPVAQLPNVKLFATRVRPMDKERVIGRARPIEEVVDHKYEGIDEKIQLKGFRGHVTYR